MTDIALSVESEEAMSKNDKSSEKLPEKGSIELFHENLRGIERAAAKQWSEEYKNTGSRSSGETGGKADDSDGGCVMEKP